MERWYKSNPHIINQVYKEETLIQYVMEMQKVNVDMIRFIVQNRADLTIKNYRSQTPLQRAKELERLYSRPNPYNRNWASDYKKYQDIVKILEKAGAKE